MTLKTATEWQNEQKEREAVINKKISMQTDHIRFIEINNETPTDHAFCFV